MLSKVNESKFNMWRAVVAFIHADGKVHPLEDKMLTDQFKNIPFSDDQIKILQEDMREPKSIDPFFDGISSPGDRSQFIYFARLLLWSDGNYSEQENSILQRFRQETLKRADLKKAMKSVDQIAAQFSLEHKNRDFRTLLADFVAKFLNN